MKQNRFKMLHGNDQHVEFDKMCFEVQQLKLELKDGLVIPQQMSSGNTSFTFGFVTPEMGWFKLVYLRRRLN